MNKNHSHTCPVCGEISFNGVCHPKCPKNIRPGHIACNGTVIPKDITDPVLKAIEKNKKARLN